MDHKAEVRIYQLAMELVAMAEVKSGQSYGSKFVSTLYSLKLKLEHHLSNAMEYANMIQRKEEVRNGGR